MSHWMVFVILSSIEILFLIFMWQIIHKCLILFFYYTILFLTFDRTKNESKVTYSLIPSSLVSFYFQVMYILQRPVDCKCPLLLIV